MKRIVKLINNERSNAKFLAKKACDATSYDACAYIDNASCSVSSLDICGKDYAGCTGDSTDDCSSKFGDYFACSDKGRDINF